MANDAKYAEVKGVFNRIKVLADIKKDSELAAILGMSTRNIISYKERGTLPWEYLSAFAKQNNYSLDYIINGVGSPTSGKIEDATGLYIVKTNHDNIYDIAALVYAELEAQDKHTTTEKFRQVVKLLHRGMLETGAPPSDDKIKEMILLI